MSGHGEELHAIWFAGALLLADKDTVSLAETAVEKLAAEGLIRAGPAASPDEARPTFVHTLYQSLEPAAVDADNRFSSIRFNLWTTVDRARHCVTVSRRNGVFDVVLGDPADGDAAGFETRTAERQERRRLEKLIVRDLAKEGFAVSTRVLSPATTLLQASVHAGSVDRALSVVDRMAEVILGYLGLEAAVFNLSKARANVREVMDEVAAEFIYCAESARAAYPDCVFFTELTTCPRCRSKWPDAVRLTRLFPGMPFCFVFLNKSRAVFKQKIFSEQCPQIMREGQVAPMVFFVKGGRVQEYLGTPLQEAPPSWEETLAAFRRCFPEIAQSVSRSMPRRSPSI